jgi:hypothetical protein
VGASARFTPSARTSLSRTTNAIVHVLLARDPMDESSLRALLDQLIRLEGDRLDVYRDIEGKFSLAGHAAEPEPALKREGPTILERDVRGVVQELEELWPVVNRLDAVRKRVISHMAFNLEVRGLLTMKRFVSAVEFLAWDEAADEMLISQWAKQAPGRAAGLAHMMRTGRG